MSDRLVLEPGIEETPGFAKIKRVVEIMTEICEAIELQLPFKLEITDEKQLEILVSTPLGEFMVIDCDHADHWTGAMQIDGKKVLMGRCFELHQVLFMSLSTMLADKMHHAVAYRDGMPPPHELH